MVIGSGEPPMIEFAQRGEVEVGGVVGSLDDDDEDDDADNSALAV